MSLNTFSTNAHALAAAAIVAIGEDAAARRADREISPISQRYFTREAPTYNGGWLVMATGGREVDQHRTRSGAEHAARLLNTGNAHVEPHRPVGTRVMPNEQGPRVACVGWDGASNPIYRYRRADGTIDRDSHIAAEHRPHRATDPISSR
jgi:hypothetical protein